MYWSQWLIPTLKEVPVGTEAMSHQLLLRAGLVNMLTSGVYSYLPMGLRVLRNIENIIREEMNACGAQELFLPCLQPLDLWKTTGRDEVLAEIMIRFQDNRGRQMCLGPTHEEVITELVKNYVQSYRQLPMTLYQIQTKFRDELRTRFGIVRACEFIMKDAYSFDRNAAGLQQNYEKMYEAYQKIFQRCGVPVCIIEADSGAMGGDVSHEYLCPAPIGEDELAVCEGCGFSGRVELVDKEPAVCPQCAKALQRQPAIELGHIFQLGTKYSQAQEALFLDEDGVRKPVIMGCYGIGVSRLIAAVIEKNYDDAGIIWPKEVAPFDVEILALQPEDEAVCRLLKDYEPALEKEGLAVLIDDRKESPGRKFADADLIGIPYRVVIGQRGLKEGCVEIKNRLTQEVIKVKVADLINRLVPLVKGHDGS